MKFGKILSAYFFGMLLGSGSLLIADDAGSYADDTESSSSIVANESVEVLPMECGTLANHYGPFDYTNYEDYSTKLQIVEAEHFTPNIEALVSGNTTISALGDIEYTLRTFPNHHRALAAVSKFEFQVEDAQEYIEGGLSPECFFKRAVAFKPLDGVVRLIYGTYLHKKKKFTAAASQYEKALKINPNSAEVHYNVALLYLDTGKTNLAVEHGQKAYELGYPLPGLKEKLVKKGVWGTTISQN